MKEINEIGEIKKIKKVELHLHLDGSMSLEFASKLSNLKIDDVKDKMIAKEKCQDLTEYLEKFSFPISLMQTKENLKLVASDLVNRLEMENVIYAEIRFAPILHTKEGLTMDDVVLSVLEGLKENKKVKTNLILCMMKGFSFEDNLKTIDLAKKYLNKGVCGVDLAGDEKQYRLKKYLGLFKILKNFNIPFTIHVGEVSKKDIKYAIKIGAKRIGHGVKICDSNKLINIIKDKNILLEICPTSNIQTNAFLEYLDHPIYKFYKSGLNISINTDNRTVSNVSLNQEYEKLINNFKFTIEDLKMINKNTLNYAFINPKEKIFLLNDLES